MPHDAPAVGVCRSPVSRLFDDGVRRCADSVLIAAADRNTCEADLELSRITALKGRGDATPSAWRPQDKRVRRLASLPVLENDATPPAACVSVAATSDSRETRRGKARPQRDCRAGHGPARVAEDDAEGAALPRDVRGSKTEMHVAGGVAPFRPVQERTAVVGAVRRRGCARQLPGAVRPGRGVSLKTTPQALRSASAPFRQ